MIELRDLSFSYGDKPVLKELSFSFEKGRSYAVIGASGCGKTSLLYLISALRKPNSGELWIAGEPLLDVRKETALILQNHGLFPWLNARDNCRLGLKQKHKQEEAIYQRLGITDLLHRYPHQLSGGQQQRIAIARALLRDSDILLLDEISASLDSMTQETIQDLILTMQKEMKQTMILVSHNIEEAVYMGETILVMKQGEISHIIDNQAFFRHEDRRNDPLFFEQCRQVRKLLYENA